MPQRPVDATVFGDTISFTDKHLHGHAHHAKSCSLLCDGEEWRVSPGLLRKIINL